MVGSLIINVLVYTHNGGSPVTSSIDLKINICDSHKNNFGGLTVDNFWLYMPGGSPNKK